MRMLRCPSCGRYTLSAACGCGTKAVSAHPPRFSPVDPHARERLKLKKEMGLV